MYRKSNARLFAVSPALPERSRKVITRHKLDFEILFDEGGKLAGQLDLNHGFPEDLKTLYLSVFNIDVGAANGDGNWILPMPSRFIVDQQHQLKSVEVNASYYVRPEPEDTLQVVMA